MIPPLTPLSPVGHRIFVNHGALMQSETPNQIIGVLAHETGHLAGGHLAKLHEQVAAAQTQMVIAMLLGAGALAAGAKGNGQYRFSECRRRHALRAAGSDPPQPALLCARTGRNADRAGVKFLTATGQSAKGMYETFKRFTNDSLFAAHGSDPYVQSHPMPAERVAALEEIAHSSPYWDKKRRYGPATCATIDARQDLGLHGTAGHGLSALSAVEHHPALTYAHAISTYLHGDLQNALTQIDGLIQVQPNNPYFYELRGQALLEGGKPAEAIAPLRKAVQLSNNAPLIEMLLGQALVASDNKAYADEAIGILRAAVARESDAPLGFSQLAMAYGRKGDLAEADLASAQAGLSARRQQDRARSCLPRENPFRRRHPRMGQGRRHHLLEATQE